MRQRSKGFTKNILLGITDLRIFEIIQRIDRDSIQNSYAIPNSSLRPDINISKYERFSFGLKNLNLVNESINQNSTYKVCGKHKSHCFISIKLRDANRYLGIKSCSFI
jgi:hypothetical protein